MCCIRMPVLIVLLVMALPAAAGTVYKCMDARGHVGFQDTPCPAASRQSTQRVPEARPAPTHMASPPPAPQPPEPEPQRASAPAPQTVRARPSALFRCIRATDGHAYLSRKGHPLPYRAPLGMLGIVPVPLSEQYRHPRGPRVDMSTLIGGNYTWVRDTCHRLTLADACATLARRNAANNQAIHDAFPDERAPLLEKRAQLHAQMAACRR